MEHEFEWIRDDRALADVLGRVGAGPMALDLEADSFHHYRESVCLIQLTLGGRHFLIDPLADLDPAALGPVLADRSVRKILHGADYDLRILHREYALRFEGLFDTMVAARLVGERSFGLADLLKTHLGVQVDKAHQRADWSRRPLPAAMLDYAVKDTAYLRELSDRLEGRLVELGRLGWVEEECRALEAVRWTRVDGDADAYLRVKGARALDRRGLTVLREVCAFRDARARRRDVALFRVMHDEVLVELSRRRPATEDDLQRVPRLPRTFRYGRGAQSLLQAVQRGRECPRVDLPEPGPGMRKKPGSARKKLDREARGKRDAVAAELDLDPSVLLSRKLLEPILDRIERNEPWSGVEGLRRWQAALLEDAFRDL